MNNKYDVIVIGGGHAGCEAAHAAHRKKLKTCLISISESSIGQMSCNPAIGGLGKTHLVKEIDAAGGIMAEATDASGIQYRTLNTRKGQTVRSLRVQCDRDKYKEAVQKIIKGTDIEEIKKKTQDLVQSSMKLGEAFYKSQQNTKSNDATKANDKKKDEGKKDDNVVDADFEEVKEEVKDENKEKSA